MQKMFIVTAIAVVVISMSVSAQSAQKINTDSLSLISKISANQVKLAKMQNEVDQKTKEKQDYATSAQESADKNKTAAARLSDDPTDKKEARLADNSASDARSDAKKARKASDRLKDLNKDIADMKAKIAKDQDKLNAYMPVAALPAAVVTVPAVPVVADSTQHVN
jgi:cell division protein FtsL